jgi:hypothetical protein
MTKFFQRLYEICLFVGVFGLFLLVIGLLFCSPLNQFGFGCLMVGIVACIIKYFVLEWPWKWCGGNDFTWVCINCGRRNVMKNCPCEKTG